MSLPLTGTLSTRMTATRQHDYLNRLTSIATQTNASGPAQVSFGYAYNDASQRVRSTMTDGSYWLYSYDALGQVRSGKRYWKDGTPVAGQHFEYGNDDIGNRSSTKAGGTDSGTGLRAATYTANNLNQYTSRDVPGAVDVVGVTKSTASVTINSSAATARKGMYYQREVAVNNASAAVWQNLSVTATEGANQTTQSGNTFVSRTPESFTHDLDGNLTADGRWDYLWDGENRLTRLVARTAVGPQLSVNFGYDWKGRRITKVVSNWTGSAWSRILDERFLYDGWNLVAQLNATNMAVIRTFMWGNDLSGTLQGAGGVGGLLAVKDTAGGTHAVAYDGNGNVAALIAGTDGSISAQFEYEPFGEGIRSSGTMAKSNPFRFSTKFQDDETDLVYYGYRFYNAATGRWPSLDPIGELGFTLLTTGRQPSPAPDLDDDEPGIRPNRRQSKPSELSLYGFVLNDPQNRVDPLGLISFDRCSDEKQATLTAAWNSVCQMVNDPKFQCCVGRSTFLQMFKRRCAWGNVKFKCRNSDEGLCPWVCAHAWQSLGIGRGVIVVCDRDPSECNMPSWKCLLAHEFSHVIGWDPGHGGVTKTVDNCCRQH